MIATGELVIGVAAVLIGAIAYADFNERGRWLSAAASVVFLIGGVGSLIAGLQHFA